MFEVYVPGTLILLNTAFLVFNKISYQDIGGGGGGRTERVEEGLEVNKRELRKRGKVILQYINFTDPNL